ncbi:MAG TPA: hydroxyisourate hydrolase [Jatrophihabitans sp.]|nr:hydroxyisourate hydrolase [Jatrophihabitans sp.]
MSLSTHVLDATSGSPAVGVEVRVESCVEGTWQPLGAGVTDADGRIGELATPGVGVHRITFDTAAYFERAGVRGFYPEVSVTFEVVDGNAHHHVPLLLSPFAYSTYRGS